MRPERSLSPRPLFRPIVSAVAKSGAMPMFAGGGPSRYRTNLCLQSQDFNTTWTKVGSTPPTVTIDAVVAPDGSTTADNLIGANGTFATGLSQTVTVLASALYTSSVYLKDAAGYDWVELTAVSTSTWRAWFNVNTGVFGSSSGTPRDFTIVKTRNGFYRCSITVLTGTTTLAFTISPRSADASSADTAGDGATVGVTLWGGQIEKGAEPTAYIPTLAAAVTEG